MKKMSIWTWLGAVFPILFLFLMMSVFHMKTERAAFLGIICAMISAILIGKSTPQIVTMDLEKGAFSALNILIVIWPAVFLYEMMEFAGVFQSIKQMLQKKTQDELVMVLLICWLFSSFLQGITGFGVPVGLCTDFNCTWCSAIMVRHNHPFRTCLGKHLRNLCLSVGCPHHTVRNTENI